MCARGVTQVSKSFFAAAWELGTAYEPGASQTPSPSFAAFLILKEIDRSRRRAERRRDRPTNRSAARRV
eukprot:COSAG06_NODE_22929_length_708_cov_1.510673_1_plen_68_part_01